MPRKKDKGLKPRRGVDLSDLIRDIKKKKKLPKVVKKIRKQKAFKKAKKEGEKEAQDFIRGFYNGCQRLGVTDREIIKDMFLSIK